MNPVVERLQKEKYDLIQFRKYLWRRNRREPCEIKVEFYNSRFGTPSGFAMLEVPGMPMNKVVDAIDKVVEEQIIELNRKIEEYEGNDRANNSMGSMDNPNG